MARQQKIQPFRRPVGKRTVRPGAILAPSGEYAPFDGRTDRIIASLNPEQYEAAMHVSGPALVIAGPGAGKTRTMTVRAHALALGGVNPARIVMMTFTRKAAEEMRTRLAAINPDYGEVVAGTFHSLAINILKRWSERDGLEIIDEDEERGEFFRFFQDRFGEADEDILDALCEASMKLGLHRRSDSGEHDLLTLKKIAKFYDGDEADSEDIVWITDIRTNPELRRKVLDSFFASLARSGNPIFGEDREANFDAVRRISRAFDAHKRECGLLSFDDCILQATEVLDGPWGDRIRADIDYVCVDEFQDSDEDQLAFVNALSRHNGNVMVVGDAKQSIYCWRGASPKVLDEFRARWNPETYFLRQCYRCDADIIDSVNSLIRTGHRPDETIAATRETRGDVIWARLPQEGGVEGALSRAVRKYGAKNVAVLVRSHYFKGSELAQTWLTQQRIPFTVVGGKKITDRVLFKRFRDIVRLMASPGWPIPLISLSTLFSGIGTAAAGKISLHLRDCAGLPEMAERLNALSRGKVSKTLARGISQMGDFLGRVARARTPGEAMQSSLHLLAAILRQKDEKRSIEDILKSDARKFARPDMPVVGMIESLCKSHRSARAWLDAVNADSDPGEKGSEGVTVSTIHGAKGKEWDAVIMPEIEGFQFPSRNVKRLAEAQGRDVLAIPEGCEEHNMLFVGASRAKRDLCFITAPDAPVSDFFFRAVQHLESTGASIREIRDFSELSGASPRQGTPIGGRPCM